MTKQSRRPNRYTHPRKGVMVALVCFMLVVIFGTIAFVSDLGNIIVIRTTLGASADAAALAGAGAMAQSYSLDQVKPIAVEYGLANVPENYGDVLDQSSVTFGTWDPETHTFTPTNLEPNAVRVVVERTAARNNAVPYFFAKIFGFGSTEVAAEAIAVGANSTTTPLNDGRSVYVTSTKELSNVVLDFGPDEFGNPRQQKFDGLSGYTGNFEGVGDYEGLDIVGVWIKSGCNASGDGPGYGVYIPSDYGEHIDNPGDGYTSHGDTKNKGCIPHVTATFEAAQGVEFTDSGSYSPVRLVK
ncbi:MAG TPA: TadG family pilus assembly protein [Lacipirellulaceae bacterium]|jgi:hypothetical protein|nr:TadG family pilus assembly protein [Lacipirellulaceae bacterium]